MQKEISPKITALTFGVLVICFAVAFYVVAWQEPTQAPPGGNVPAPLNVGPTGQAKEGGLILNTGGAKYGLIVDKGDSELGGSLIFRSMSRPASPQAGQLYFEQNDSYLYYYTGSEWIKIEGAVVSAEAIPCTDSSECESGYCVDGYCCDSACDTTCYACNVPGNEGNCTPLTNYAEDDGCSSACKGCDGGSCVNIPQGVKDIYGPNQCTALHNRCDGAGSCTAPTIGGCVDCPANGASCYTICAEAGYDTCEGGCWLDMCPLCLKSCDAACRAGSWLPECKCANWIYD